MVFDAQIWSANGGKKIQNTLIAMWLIEYVRQTEASTEGKSIVISFPAVSPTNRLVFIYNWLA